MEIAGFDIVQQRDSVAIAYGRTYDFDKIFNAYFALMEVVASMSGGPSWTKPTPWITGPNGRYPLSRENIRRGWDKVLDRWQVSDEHISHVVGGLTFRAYLLGRTRLDCNLGEHTLCIHGTKRPVGRVPYPNGNMMVVAIESQPEVEIFGGEDGRGALLGAPKYAIERVRTCVETNLKSYGLKMEDTGGAGDDQFAVVSFPFKRFHSGTDGYGPIRVRCNVFGHISPKATTA